MPIVEPETAIRGLHWYEETPNYIRKIYQSSRSTIWLYESEDGKLLVEKSHE